MLAFLFITYSPWIIALLTSKEHIATLHLYFVGRTSELLTLLSISILIEATMKIRIYLLSAAFLTISALFSLLHIALTGYLLNESSIYIIASSNYQEGSEYIFTYLSTETAIALILYLAISLYLVSAYIRKFVQPFSQIKYALYFSLITAGLSLNIQFHSHFSNRILGFTPIPEITSYIQNMLEMDALLKKQNKIVEKGAIDARISDSTHVVVIGESLSRNYMGVYGYKRVKNTPNLTRLLQGKEIQIYRNVVSADTYTVSSLLQSLTFDGKYNSILRVANAAGYETHWISNQSPIGFVDNPIASIAQQAQHTTYLNASGRGFSFTFESDTYLNKPNYDEVVLKPFKKALKSSAKNKVIFVHLLGNHSAYSKRYPETFSKFKHPENERIAQYENSILYNDYIINSLIELLRESSTEKVASLLYFSDHGDAPNAKQAPHGNYKITPDHFEIPFILWVSDTYKTTNSTLTETTYQNADIYFKTDSLTHSLIDLFNISGASLYDPDNSFFSNKYTPPKTTPYTADNLKDFYF